MSERRRHEASKACSTWNARIAGLVYMVGAFLSCFAAMAQSAKPIYQSGSFSVWPDRVVQGAWTAHAVSRTEIDSNYPMKTGGATANWVQSGNLSRLPATHSEYPLFDAIYGLSLEELQKDTAAAGTFDAGAKWPGVWTRDTSYSIVLSLAAIEPEIAKASLLKKVRRDRIVQDTGSGGSWPVSSDRVTWALAAWEVYLVTGDRAWLEQSYTIIRNSILDDQQVVISPQTGLARGESTFLDWRKQTYPRWMEPADIYGSEALGTNAVYYRTYRILAAMARLLSEPATVQADWNARAARIQAAINERFWVESKGYYGQYLYGRVWPSLSPRAEALGEALTTLFDIPDASRQERVLHSQPLMAYGVPTVFPETPNIEPYHNRSVWPFVQAFWNLAAARQGNGPALVYGLASISRAAALFVTNKENFQSDTGDATGTAVNSDRQLWSVAGNLAMVYRVFFGMDFEEDGLHLHPVVPEELKGSRTLSNVHYRGATLDLEVRGFGSHIRTCTLDGKPVKPFISPGLTGTHHVVIELDNQPLRMTTLNLVASATAPETPEITLADGALSWMPIDGAVQYVVYRDGQRLKQTTETHLAVTANKSLTGYQVMAVNKDGLESFLSAPVNVDAAGGAGPIVIPAQGGGSGSNAEFVTLESTGSTGALIDAGIAVPGQYVLSFRYANGSGSIETENKCAIRTLFIDGERIGPIVMPQRGKDRWSDWGESSMQVVSLREGKHRFELQLESSDTNMNADINRALIQSMSLAWLRPEL
jgi:hypothetical protein